MRLIVCLVIAAAFGLFAVSTDAHAQATPPKQMSDGQLESAGKPAKAAVKGKRAKKGSKKTSN